MHRRPSDIITIDRLSIGLKRHAPVDIPPGGLQVADNWLSIGDSLITRPGYTRLTQTPFASDITGLARFYVTPSEWHVIVTLEDGDIFKVTEQEGSATLIGTHSAGAAPWRFISFAGLLIGAPGAADAMTKYDGSTWTTLGGDPPKAVYLAEHNNRAVAANTDFSATELHFSSAGDPEDWPSGHKLQFGEDDGDPITGIASIFGILTVFKTKSVWTVLGTEPSNYLPLKLPDELGCIAPRSVAEVAGAIYFLSEAGVWSFDGTRFRHRSDAVDHLLRERPGLQSSAAATVLDRYLLAYPSAGHAQNDSALVYEPASDAWFNHTNHPFDVIERRPKHDESRLYAASNQDRHIYRLYDGATDSGAPITARLRTGHLARTPGRYFTFRRVRARVSADGDPQFKMTVTAHRDRQLCTGKPSTSTWRSRPMPAR